jgi:hypothetical protein
MAQDRWCSVDRRVRGSLGILSWGRRLRRRRMRGAGLSCLVIILYVVDCLVARFYSNSRRSGINVYNIVNLAFIRRLRKNRGGFGILFYGSNSAGLS